VLYGVLADVVMVLHFAFTLFVALGALLLVWRPRIAWLHLPCLAYGAAIELVGWVCPLTPLEQRLRRLAGGTGYEGGFIAHHLGSILYPADWESLHVWLGALLVGFNLVVYSYLIRRRRA
jgi:hypothetical protein